jgi:hypothetical protein
MRTLLFVLVLCFHFLSGNASQTITLHPLCAVVTPQDSIKKEIQQFIDNWHMAASKADGNSFFGAMSDSSVYMGTDATERWSKKAFMAYAKPYFDRGKAWDFKPYDRDIHVSQNEEYVWFSELLTTRMGICRGSGIITKNSDGWKIEQYHLSVTVPNDLITDFITLVDKFNRQKK